MYRNAKGGRLMHSESEAIGITVTLLDGTIDGRYEYRLDSWNIDVYKIPHKLLKESDNYKVLHTPGVYLLFGEETTEGAPFVYVGEAEDIYIRLNQKHTFEKGVNKDAWGDAVIFVALSDGDLDKAKIKYLEGRFYEIASEAKRFVVKNGNTPKKSKLSSQNITAMENVIRKAKLVLPTTGYDVFTAKSTPVKAPKVKPQPKPEKKQGKITDLPPLPSKELGPCKYAKTGLENLLDSGYTFSEAQMKRYGSIEGSKDFTHRNNPMFWILKNGEKRADLDKTITDRYWAKVFQSGEYRFLMFSQWYKDNISGCHKSDFDNWYNSLAEE